jgi:8-oxo-dGTP diphosphatase
MPEPRGRLDVVAAGAVVYRPGSEVLLVHRPRYDDWAFPKGKLDPDEHITAAAVREVAEESGVRIRLGPPLTAQRYAIAGGRSKTVHYWVGRAVGDDDVSGYVPNEEIDGVEWVRDDRARLALTYEVDRQTLREARRLRKKTHALVVLRHGDARPRKTWRRDDRERPLAEDGLCQAERLVPVLAAYDASRVVTSSSLRCRQTVEPYARGRGVDLVRDDGLSEEDATPEAVASAVAPLLNLDAGSVLCTHRPVLPLVWEALGLERVKLEPASMLVVHHRRGAVVGLETHGV